jgi:hypothetical protein
MFPSSLISASRKLVYLLHLKNIKTHFRYTSNLDIILTLVYKNKLQNNRSDKYLIDQ